MSRKRRKPKRPAAEPADGGSALSRFWRRNRVVLKAWLLFVAVFLALLALFQRFAAAVEETAVDWTAQVTAWILRLLGAEGEALGRTVSSSLFTVNIIMECTAVFPLMIFVAAVVAYPSTAARKALGLGAGVVLILAINEVRLVSLFYVGRWYPSAFETTHLIVWQSLMVFFTLLIWLIWAHRFAGRPAASQTA